MRCRVLELFAGIGGFHIACPDAEIVAAVDISRQAQAVYSLNFESPYRIQAIESLSAEALSHFQADGWWLSPPCQPYSRRGRGRDVADPRAAGLLNLIAQLPAVRPQVIALENVLGFQDSRCYQLLRAALSVAGYRVQTIQLCPTEMSWPNRRPRFYLLASRGVELRPWGELPQYDLSWQAVLGAQLDYADTQQPVWRDQALVLEDAQYLRLRGALDRVGADDPQAVTACFASSYGKALRHSGSYLESGNRCRRFAPTEVARLLGFPAEFDLSACTPRTAWKLLGNSLSIPAVRYVMAHVDA